VGLPQWWLFRQGKKYMFYQYIPVMQPHHRTKHTDVSNYFNNYNLSKLKQ
jgi:hypothetical protein